MLGTYETSVFHVVDNSFSTFLSPRKFYPPACTRSRPRAPFCGFFPLPMPPQSHATNRCLPACRSPPRPLAPPRPPDPNPIPVRSHLPPPPMRHRLPHRASPMCRRPLRANAGGRRMLRRVATCRWMSHRRRNLRSWHATGDDPCHHLDPRRHCANAEPRCHLDPRRGRAGVSRSRQDARGRPPDPASEPRRHLAFARLLLVVDVWWEAAEAGRAHAALLHSARPHPRRIALHRRRYDGQWVARICVATNGEIRISSYCNTILSLV